MTVREVAGWPERSVRFTPAVWMADAQTLCILLDDAESDEWLLITVDLREAETTPLSQEHMEAA